MRYSKLLFFIGPFSILVIWLIIALFIKGNELYFASPKETLFAFLSLTKTSELYLDIGYTFARSFLAVAISLFLAILVVLCISIRRSFFVMSEFSIDFFRSIPSTALFPLFLVLFGINDITRICTAAFICFWIILLNLIHGIFHTSQTRVDAITLMGASKFQIFKYILIWEVLVYLFSGIKLAISTSLVIIIITEMLVSPQYGLGTRLFYAQQTYKIPQMYALIIITGILSYVVNKLVVSLERRVIHWTRR